MSPRYWCALALAPVLFSTQTHSAQQTGLALQFSLQNPPVTVTVSGTVRDKSGKVLPDATVRGHLIVVQYFGFEGFEKCPYQESRTDANGQYRLTFMSPLSTTGPSRDEDTLCVDAGAPGYETHPEYVRPSVSAKNCTFTNFDFALNPGKRLRGVVTGTDSRPVSGALLRVHNGLNGDWNFFGSLGRTLTADNGSFELWISRDAADYDGSLPWLCIWKQGSGFLFVFKLLERADLGTLVLNPGGEVIGKVVGPTGNPVPNCEVSGGWGFLRLADKTVTDQEGRYRLRGIPGEASIREFVTNRGGSYQPEHAKARFYARATAEMELKNAPNFELVAQDNQTVTAADVVAGAEASVSGTLLRSRTALGLGGLLVRLEGSWDNMVEADMNGQFRFPYVAPGKHTLTAYLPYNLRYDTGIGKTNIEVQSGAALSDVRIQLLDLAELRVQYLDANGNPLPGITAGATWSKNGEGGWTQGTVSDVKGWASLYLYPEDEQYLRGFDRSGKLTTELWKEINPKPAEVLEPMQIVMVPTASLSGRLIDDQGGGFASKPVRCTISAADGADYHSGFKTDAEGKFSLGGITPGILRLSFEIEGTEFADALGKSLELRPAAAETLGNIVLKNGLNKAKVIRQKHAQAMEQTEEITFAAEAFFKKIQNADYDYFLQPNANWQRFPLVNFYQTHHWFDVMVTWMSRTFKTNPIVTVELGQVFPNPKKLNGVEGLPTVPYKVTLKDGTLLQGDLPFEYNFDGNQGHWHGLEGVDWHLQYPNGLPGR